MNEVLTASTGVIMSQSPGSGFPHFESCSWVVKVEPGYNITFTIEHFQTSRQFDELEIFDGESPVLGVEVKIRRFHPQKRIKAFSKMNKRASLIDFPLSA